MQRKGGGNAQGIQEHRLSYEGHFEHFDGGWTVAFESYTQDADLAPFFKGLPDDRCQCEHMGFEFSPSDELARTMEVVAKNMEEVEAGSS